ncbi:hypothetical protein Q7C36_018443 [Tachysurus vachellii]|uniref:Radial spoke head protein 3 homolog n=1 Tax=Tachysurus vachellii TaxID=175792 RepID=A0AA88S5M0_TACVA|nr:hypothetical protein Q7C36_018443 [Tachysurus vachellii]
MASLPKTTRRSPNGSYTLPSRPHTDPHRRMYTDDPRMENELRPVYMNIVYDRHVVRENNTGQPDRVKLQWQPESTRGSAARKGRKPRFQTRSPGRPDKRKHAEIQTETYLEELIDHLDYVSVECQSDAFLDMPSTPLFIPAKTSKDVATQIEDGELFDIDLEIEPMMQVLVGKIMEQALLEVLKEEELAGLRAQEQAFQELCNAELVEVQRLEEQERRHREEKARRIEQQRLVLKKEQETREKIAARTFAQQFLADLLPLVYSKLRDDGYFYDPVQRDIETGYIPWLKEEVNKTLEKEQILRTVLDMIIEDVTNQKQAPSN